MGYSLLPDSPNYFGRLRPSQLNFLFDGFNKLKKREADATKRSKQSRGGRMGGGGQREVITQVGDLARIPGVKVKKQRGKRTN